MIPSLELPRFFPTYTWGKKEVISKLELFLTEWSRSDIVFALVTCWSIYFYFPAFSKVQLRAKNFIESSSNHFLNCIKFDKIDFFEQEIFICTVVPYSLE